jgi:NAD(P)-dependent dehydrogenase (short-subunit alcohol dehydrogenase family)
VDLLLEQGLAVPRGEEPGGEALAEAELPAPAEAPAAPSSQLSREVVTLVPEDLGEKDFDIKGKAVWVLGDDPAIVAAVAAGFAAGDAQARAFAFEGLTSSEEVVQAFARFADGHPVDVIVDCTHVGSPIRFDGLAPAEAAQLLFLSAGARFAAYKHLAAQGQRPARVLCLTSMDGALGLAGDGPEVADPTFGALLGLYKGLRKEWQDTWVRIVDLAPQAVMGSLDDCIRLAITEVERAGVGVEVAYPQGRRMIAVTVSKALQATETLTFSEGDTFLVTGGGTGITARIARALARAYPASFVVVDLEPLPDDIAALAALDEAGLQRLKQEIHTRLRQEHDRVTPAMLEREFGRVLKAVEIYDNLQALRDLGRRVVYIPCDIRDLDGLRPQLERARQEVGPITAIVHGAGIDRSHLIEQKSHQEFQAVFSVKAQGAYNLAKLCQDDPLRLVVAFGSISGRFGNAAQLDYCAANSFLNYWIRAAQSQDRAGSQGEQAQPAPHAVCLQWSGWKDVGIAWRNELVRQTAEEMGLNFVEVDQGVAAFLQEIEHRSGDSEVVLHRGLDGFVERGLAFPYLPDFPLIDRVIAQAPPPGQRESRVGRAYRVFSVRRDALIDQHRLGKTPIMPAVGYAELAVEYYALQAGPQGHYILRDMAFPAAFKLFREEPRELFVEGQEIAGTGAWSVEVKSSFRPVVGDEVQVILHSRATVSAGPLDLAGLDPQGWSCYDTEPTSLPADQSLLLLTSSGPEQRILLGPLYNDVMREAEFKEPVLIYPAGVVYPTYFPLEQLTNKKYPLDRLWVNPCFLDSLYQACAAHLLVNKERVYLPWEIGELGIVHVPRQKGLYRSYAQVVEESDQVVGFDVVMLDGEGRVCYYARSARFRMINL